MICVVDELYVTWRTILKGLDIRASRLWRRGEGTSWIGPLSQPCTSPRTCNELGDYVVPLPVVRAEKSFHITPHALYSVCMGACTLVNEVSAVVNGAVRATFRVQIPVLSPAITDDRSARFDPCFYNGHQSVGGSARNGNEKCFTGLALNTTKHCPLTGWPLWYLRRPNLLVLMSTVLLGPPIFSEQSSMYISTVFLQNRLHAAIVSETKRCCLCIMWAGTRRTMSYVRYITSCKSEFTLLEPWIVPHRLRLRA